MLTGDSLLTSLHVAREVGIVDTNRPCLVLKSDTNGLLTTLQSITGHFQTLERGEASFLSVIIIATRLKRFSLNF